MLFLLITFFVIALLITLVGLVLSVRTRVRAERTVYYTEPGIYSVAGPMRTRTRYPVVEPVRARRYVVEAESEISTWIPTLLGGLYGRRSDGSTNWPVVILTLIAIFLLGLYLLMDLLPSHPLIGYLPFTGNPASTSSNQSLNIAPTLFGASKALVRLSQLDPGQYDTSDQYKTWAYSACSAASMTEVLNAYGHHYRIIDILKVEARLGEITPALGLMETIGIQRTVAQFGFQTTWGSNLSLDQVIDIANHGRPVIVDFPPDKFDGGHLLVVVGGNADYVYLADSSIFNRHSLTRAQFMHWWAGFSAIVTPQ